MNGRGFSLEPFPPAGPPPSFRITGEAVRRPGTLAVRYALLGWLAELAIPAPAAAPARKDGLWEETCFELFLAVRGSKRYWEFNLSPAGHWNVYRFADYREGMEEEAAFASLPLSAESRPDSFSLTLEVDLDKIVRADQALEAGPCAVIKTGGGETAHWALSHPGPRADFHRRESFTLEL